MNRRLLPVFLLIIVLSLTATGLNFVHAQGEEPAVPPELLAKIDPRLFRQAMTAKNEPPAVIVDMKSRADLSAVTAQTADPLARRQAMVSALQSAAESAQAEVKGVLVQNQAQDIQSLWIVNSIAAKTTLPVILTLAARDDVAMIRLDTIITLDPWTPAQTDRAATGPEWGVSRVNADQVWQSLGIDGAGVVVANIDTGVDYQHPDLLTAYRGYKGGALPPVNTGNWYDATGEGAAYPIDSYGHGTHTMGTMVGADGIGVAPGAKWIAVRAFNNAGSAYESWLHAAFQWVLAPNGDTNLAPDIVNNSWSNSNGNSTIFEEDVQRLIDAGIIPIFSAGNDGPNGGSIDSPASLNVSFAVGATDPENMIANFSSRGPSAWGKLKPDVTAPGVAVLSTLPGGSYGVYNGTSMAAPHVAGVAALLLQADPTFTYAQLTRILTGTATALGDSHPNNNYGWGLVDAYAAAQQAVNAGQLTGLVSRQPTGAPIAGAEISLIPRHSGITNTATTDTAGLYRRGVVAGDYDATASAFGYASQTAPGLVITAGAILTQNFSLLPLPTGAVNGIVTQAGNGAPLEAVIRVEQTPITAAANPATGAYSLALPGGTYTLTISSPGHRIGTATVSVSTGSATRRDVALPVAPTILLVDSGPWYNAGQIDYYRQALADSAYYFDEHRIFNLPADIPISTTLTAYDVVIWSAPEDSPGYIDADTAVVSFLEDGGDLLVSGQNVAYFDGGGSPFSSAEYYYTYLKAAFSTDNAFTDTVSAVPGELFNGLNLTISGGDGADNQTGPDTIVLRDANASAPVLTYAGGAVAGQRVGHCLPYRAVNLPFGLEGINRRDQRAEIIRKSLDWFQQPPVQGGISAAPANQIGVPGQIVTHTVELRNESESGPADTYSFILQSNWPVTFPYTTVSLLPCKSEWLTFTVAIPAGIPWDTSDVFTLTAQSALSPAVNAVITRKSKTPAPVLLVDDDRWYDFETEFIQSLNDNGIGFDYRSVQGGAPMGTPPLSTLQRYPMVIWFTAYDWYSPLTPAEETTLQQYLDGGGRLALTSQEYLYALPQHKPGRFAQTYLGVESHSEYFSSTVTTGVPGNPIGNGLGPYPLTFPPAYQNWTDSLTPTLTAATAMIGESGLANALINRGGTPAAWHTAFFGFGPELLTQPDRTELLRQTTGWLSALGTSTVTGPATILAGGDTAAYTAVLTNDGPAAIASAAFTATFPYPLSLIPASITGGPVAAGNEAVWRGSLARGQSITFTYEAQVDNDASYGTLSRQISRIELGDHRLVFDRVASAPVNVPDWVGTTFTAGPAQTRAGDEITFTLRLLNTGTASAPVVTATVNLPPHLRFISAEINPLPQTKTG